MASAAAWFALELFRERLHNFLAVNTSPFRCTLTPFSYADPTFPLVVRRAHRADLVISHTLTVLTDTR